MSSRSPAASPPGLPRLFAALLLAALVAGGARMCGKLYDRARYDGIAQSSRRAGLALMAMSESRLSGKTRQEIAALLEPLYAAHPAFLEYKKHQIFRAEYAAEKDCLPFGGTHFVFRDGKFAFFDTARKCEGVRYTEWFYAEDLKKDG